MTNPATCNCGEAPGLGHRHGCAIFACSVCGVQCSSSPIDGPTFCEAHCPDHDYRYERSERRHRCQTCDAEPPDDWYAD